MKKGAVSIGHWLVSCTCFAVFLTLLMGLFPLPSSRSFAENLFDWSFPLEFLCFGLFALCCGRAAGHAEMPVSFGIGVAVSLQLFAWCIGLVIAPSIAIVFLALAGSLSIFLLSSGGHLKRQELL